MRKENAVVYQNHIAFSTTCCVKIMGNRIMLRFLFCQGGQSGTFHFQQLEVVQSMTCFIFILCLSGQNIHVCKTLLIDADSLFLLVYVYCFSPLYFSKPRKCSIAFFICWSPSRKLNMEKKSISVFNRFSAN